MEHSDQFHESFRQGLTAGYTFAATFVIVIYMSYYLPAQLVSKGKNNKCGCMKAKQKRKLPHQELKQEMTKEKRQKVRQVKKYLTMGLQDRRIQLNEIGWLARRMSFIELCDATKYFSMESAIGVGMMGTMYKATLPNGLVVAVKRLYDSKLFIRMFELEIMILRRYNHRNIIPLIGFCIEEERHERILVYQYMSNGRLSNWLKNTITLGWHAVIRIALGVARGLSCLHHNLQMVHLSIKSESILLENNFEPKVSNFKRAIFINHDLDKNVGFEKDVYDFGTLLFEMIRGKSFDQAHDCYTKNNGPFETHTYPTNLLEDPFGFYDVMDKYLNEIEFEDEVSALLRVACDCVHPVPHQRPTMLEVYSKMSNIWERDGIFEDSLTSYYFDSVPTTISGDEYV